MIERRDFDVAIVGASVAGCTAARLFAQVGARVALIEKRSDPAAYKVACTHAILSPATPVLERLGLASKLRARGVPRTWFQFWTRHGGWLSSAEDLPDGWGVTRRTLDPMLRELAIASSGVEYFAGWEATRIPADAGRPGLVARDRRGRDLQVRARLIVGADGRGSEVARLAGIPARVRPHNRFFYFAYWRGIQHSRIRPNPPIRIWLLEPDGASQFPNEDDLTVLVTAFHRSRLAEVRADLERHYMRHLSNLPNGPDLSKARRVSKILGKLEVPNMLRPAGVPGIALVGDAALASDPAFGVGITFALQSAAWLVDATGKELDGGPALERSLARYRRKHLLHLGPHHAQMADFSTGRPLRAFERLAFRKAARDPQIARVFTEVLARERSVFRWLSPSFATRLATPERPSAPNRETEMPRPTLESTLASEQPTATKAA